MLREGRNLIVTGLCLAACSAAWAQQKARPASEKDWQEALAAIRQIALDKGQAEDRRANAIRAYAKLLLRRKRHDEALTLCREVLKGPAGTGVIDAALRAGCLVERDRHGHLRAELDFLASPAAAPHKHAASAIRRDLDRAVRTLTSLAARTMVPSPVAARLPHWAAARAGKGPSALHVAPPRIQPPHWYAAVKFPLLKGPRKK
jgi:hypothetical protein